MLGFASPQHNFRCSEQQLVVPVHRSSGADGTVAVPWYTRDATAIGECCKCFVSHGICFRPGGFAEQSKSVLILNLVEKD